MNITIYQLCTGYNSLQSMTSIMNYRPCRKSLISRQWPVL